MTDAEIIAALAAELERLRRLPFWATMEAGNATPKTLAALSGVAAEFISEYDRPKIGFYANAGWYVTDRLDDEEDFETYHEALIAALKQVESEVKNG